MLRCASSFVVAAYAKVSLISQESRAGLGMGGYRIEIGRKVTGYIEATDVRVTVAEPHRQPHRRLKEIIKTIRNADLSEGVKRTAEGIFTRLAGAEGRGDGVSPGA